MTETEVSNRKDLKSHVISVLPHNVQSLNNKLMQLVVLCFKEHWQKEEQIKLSNPEQFKLVSAFSRISSKHRGSCICVKKILEK